jgi:5-methylcytosine-specific restriction endonuclease McrA
MARDCGLCQINGTECRFIATEVDHKVSKAKARALGWTDEQIDDDSNLQATCTTCHKAKTAAERRHAG